MDFATPVLAFIAFCFTALYSLYGFAVGLWELTKGKHSSLSATLGIASIICAFIHFGCVGLLVEAEAAYAFIVGSVATLLITTIEVMKLSLGSKSKVSANVTVGIFAVASVGLLDLAMLRYLLSLIGYKATW